MMLQKGAVKKGVESSKLHSPFAIIGLCHYIAYGLCQATHRHKSRD